MISNARGAAVLQHPGIQNGSVVLNPCGRVITARRRSELGPRLRLVETVAFGQINLRSPSARSRVRVSLVLALVLMGGQFGLMTFVATAEGLLRGMTGRCCRLKRATAERRNRPLAALEKPRDLKSHICHRHKLIFIQARRTP